MTANNQDDGQITRSTPVVAAQFAGRVGGNQEFIADSDDDSLLKKQPDAAPLQSISASFDLKTFADGNLWRMAFLEGLGTMLLVFLLGSGAIGLSTVDQSIFARTLYGALTQWLGLSIFILTLGPVSGGHLNPTITFATLFAGLSTVPRSILYIAAQIIGSIVAAFLLKFGAGSKNYFSADFIPGCSVDPTMVSAGQMFVLEFLFCFAAIFMAFGVGLDPRQSKIYGPAFAPILVGITIALTTLCSALFVPGYGGASLNPARCLGLMTAKFDLRCHWVHWVADVTATSLNGLIYHIAPPWRKEGPLLSRATNFISRSLHAQKDE